MIEIKNVSFGYKKKYQLYDQFNLNIEKGSIYGLLGKNGTGKSTLLHLMSGLLRPQEGTILFNGIDVGKRSVESLSNIFLVSEEYSLPKLTMRKYYEINAPFYPQFSIEMMKSCLDGFGMSDSIHLGELSMGQKKKAFMCFALATNVPLLLMDEPSNGLDIPSKNQFRNVVAKAMTDDRTIVISTHQVRDIDSLLDRVVVLDNSEMLLNESVANITEKLFFGERTLSENDCDDFLFEQPSVHGNYYLRMNRGNEDCALNLEVLFNALLSERKKISDIFNENKNV